MRDFRSDTVTRPTSKMLNTLTDYTFGVNAFEEDEATKRLISGYCSLFKKESALFVPSGTMGNLLALTSHCRRGGSAVVGSHSHVVNWERGNLATFGRVYPQIIQNTSTGEMPLNEIEAAFPVNTDF